VLQLQQWMTAPHYLISFSIFFPEFMIKHIKTETVTLTEKQEAEAL